jgi:hypothetical protein
MAHPFGNDPAKIDGYRRFWARDEAERPLVGFSFKSWPFGGIQGFRVLAPGCALSPT